MDELLNISVTDIIQAVITIANIFIVYLVYKLTKKDINPKLHLVPTKRKPLDIIREDDEYSIFSTYDGYSRAVNHELFDIDFDQRGFPEQSQYHPPLIWELILHNKGEYNASFIELEYELIIYKVDMKFGTDEADVVEEAYVPYKTIKRKESFEYLAPDDHRKIKVLYLLGEFIKADLVVTSLKSKEIEFITSPIVVDKYSHPTLEWLSDGYHHRQVIGAHKPVK